MPSSTPTRASRKRIAAVLLLLVGLMAIVNMTFHVSLFG